MKTISEYKDLKRIKKLERDYFDTLDDEAGELVDIRIKEYETKYNKEYFLEWLIK